MHKHLLTVYLLLLAMVVTAAEPYSSSRIFWDSSTRTTVFTTGWYARMIELQDGRLMAACEHSGIEVAFSSDKGQTWSTPTKIATNHDNIGMRVPDLAQLHDGTIVVSYNPRPEEPYTSDRKFGIRCKRSTDNGKTWGEEIFVYDAQHTFGDGCWEPSLLELPSGELQLYFSNEGIYTQSNEQNISLCRSFDGGVTWGDPEIVSFRNGYRDGMPCPVLLKDNSQIVLTIEDNGWPGVGDFFPTTVRCPLDVNWHNYLVNGDSPNRAKTLDFAFCPNATGGAPYLRVLPWGETVMSYQSAYGRDGRLSMYVALGDAEARNFRSLQHPFKVENTHTVMWNSLCVADTGIVIAVGGVGNRIEMIKGYPVRRLQAPYAHATVDGRQTRGEGYYKPQATQVLMGIERGVRTTADICYDADSIYFTARVSDRTEHPLNNAYGDGVTLLIDAADRCSLAPLDGMHRIFLRRAGTAQLSHGNDSKKRWTTDNNLHVHLNVTEKNTYYIIEAAIPWTDLALTKAPEGASLQMNIEVQDNTIGDYYPEKEYLPDGRRDESWTWMELYLQPNPEPTGINTPIDSNPQPSSPNSLPKGAGADYFYKLNGISTPIGREMGGRSHNPSVVIVNGKKILMK